MVEHDGALDLSPSLDDASAAKNGGADQHGPAVDATGGTDHDRPLVTDAVPVCTHVQTHPDAGTHLAAGGRGEIAPLGQEVLHGRPVVGGVADIDPAEGRLHRVKVLTRIDQGREELRTDVVDAVLGNVAEDRGLEDVDSGIGEVASGVFGCGFLLKRRDAACGVSYDDSVGRDLGAANSLADDCGDGTCSVVRSDNGREVEVDDGIAAYDEECRIEEAGVRLHAREAARATRRVVTHRALDVEFTLERVRHGHAEARAVAEVVLDLVGQIGRVHHNLVETVPVKQVDDELHHRPPEHRDHWLGKEVGEGAHARALACGEDHGLHR